ncbi:MAG: DUF998 domain-containing protein [Thermoplasmata archaeon]
MVVRGPMVHRNAQWGGAVFLVGSLQFIVAMIVTQLYYNYPPNHGPYSLTNNYISDLGHAGSGIPWLFNDSIRVLGLLGLGGAYLIYRAFAPRMTTKIGIVFLMIATLGAIGVGSFPEGSPELGGGIHSVVSLITFLGSGFALVVLAVAMLRDTRWDGYRIYTLLSGLITLIAIALFVAAVYPGLGPGGMERIVVAPILLWAIVAGVHLLRLETFDPTAVARSADDATS